jgi:DNA-binding response OmpR family regulator
MHAQPIHTHASCVRSAGPVARAEPPAVRARLAARAEKPAADAGRPTVLLADGGTDVHAIFGAVLEREGYRVIHAFTPAECLHLAHVHPVGAALVSVGWCGLLTWRRLHDLAAEAAAGGFAIVCLTTDPRLDPDTRRVPPGTASVLTLPCTPEALAAEVRRAVGVRTGQPN